MNESQLREIEERAERASSDYTGTDVRVLVNTDVPALVAEVRRLRVRVNNLQSALKWYANKKHYNSHGVIERQEETRLSSKLVPDNGDTARAALQADKAGEL